MSSLVLGRREASTHRPTYQVKAWDRLREQIEGQRVPGPNLYQYWYSYTVGGPDPMERQLIPFSDSVRSLDAVHRCILGAHNGEKKTIILIAAGWATTGSMQY